MESLALIVSIIVLTLVSLGPLALLCAFFKRHWAAISLGAMAVLLGCYFSLVLASAPYLGLFSLSTGALAVFLAIRR